MVKYMFNYLKQNKKYLIFVGIIILIGLICGIGYYIFLNGDMKSNITDTINSYNNYRYNAIIKDLIIMSLLFVTSIFLVGIPFSLFYLFYEGLSLGLIITIFVVNFKLSGLFYILLYILINKLLVLLLMAFFVKKIINIGRYIIGIFIYKNDNLIKNKLVFSIKNCMYLIVAVFVINILLYFITPSIFSYLSFLLK